MIAQLFYTPTSCGAASFIAAHRAGLIGSELSANLIVDRVAKHIKNGDMKGKDFRAINPKGNVPAILLSDGTLLNEGAAVLQWIADRRPEVGLAPPNGTHARYLLQSKLNWLASELHATCSPLFYPTTTPEVKEYATSNMKTKLQYLSDVELAGGKKSFLVGDQFTVADSYCYIILSWLGFLGLSLEEFPVLKVYYDSIGSLEFVKEAHAKMAEINGAEEA